MIAKSLVLLAVALNLASAGKVPAPIDDSKDVDFIDYYNCKGITNGNYYHPWDCTKFITCSNGYASERDCAACNPGDSRCPDGRTHFDEPSDACLWPDVARCTGGPRPTTENPGVTERPSECKPDCNEEGDCKSFKRCDRRNGTEEAGDWVDVNCGTDLWWNPSGDAALHGGTCTKWGDLPTDVQDRYTADESCIPPPPPTTEAPTTPAPEEPCDWYPIGACSDGYLYNHPIRTGGVNVTLTCPGGLLWNQDTKSCDNCDAVTNEAGAPCCTSAPGEEGASKEIFSCEGLKDGIYKNERSCRTFWKCLNGNPAKISCPADQVFNTELLVCEPEELGSHFCNGIKI